jgi:hypothetical protein
MKIRGRLELAKFRLGHASKSAKGIFVGCVAWLPFAIVTFAQGKMPMIPLSPKVVFSILSIGVLLIMLLWGIFLPELREVNRRHNSELNAIRRKHNIPERFL